MIPRPGSPAAILIASDHSAFVGVMTNLLLGLIAAVATTRDRTAAALERLALAVLNLGLVVFVVGLVADSAEIKRIGAATMGTASSSPWPSSAGGCGRRGALTSRRGRRSRWPRPERGRTGRPDGST